MASVLRSRLPRALSASVAAAGGVALSAYMFNSQPPLRAAEPDGIYVINGCVLSTAPLLAPTTPTRAR